MAVVQHMHIPYWSVAVVKYGITGSLGSVSETPRLYEYADLEQISQLYMNIIILSYTGCCSVAH